ncbi:Ech hydrogenase subunit B [Methanocella paludicola SANAE]|uniref:Ech hydrogenase subunit B n=1 Tax=Methanocella paludicola (strain DSM 17711 / JCM 13418 / NBRC 101707 / SANAE) TaxID=304371 RepID=D1YVT1_METPS|nr:NADH-quinone oxidoreductase subunit H [Methanocella paludicola]BAI60553.1 Ech hydrogenase subunit B [Methanocella paludicola SANAE]
MADNILITYGVPLLLLILSPIIGGLLIGIDRKVTARIQNRSGPPIVQPFYDTFKLFGKEDKIVNKTYLVFGAAYLLTVILSLALLLFQYDLLITTFIFGLSFIFLVLAGYSTRSQFGNVGATRELMQMLTYEPILLFAVFLIRLVTGSFEIESIYSAAQPLLYTLPLALLAIFIILPIKARKSPFDIAEAHQEIAQGPETEYSGKYLGLLLTAHFFEMFFILWFVSLFFVKDVALGGLVIPGVIMQVLMMLVAYVFLIVVDNATARLRVDQMLKQVFIVGMVLLIINLIYIIVTGRWIA